LSPCAEGTTCFRGACVPCAVCGRISDNTVRQTITDALLNAGIPAAQVSDFVDAANAAAAPRDVPPGTFVRIPGTGTIERLAFAGNGSANAGAAVQIAGTIDVTDLQVTNIPGVVSVSATARLNAAFVNISRGQALSIDTATGGRADFTQLRLEGSMTISGSGLVRFPTTAADVTVGGGSTLPTVQVSGGAAIVGNMGGAGLVLRSNTGASGMARIPGGNTFTISGPISGDGTLQVEGSAVFGGSNINAAIAIRGGRLRVESPAVSGGSISMNASSTLEIAADGRGIQFESIDECPAGSSIIYHVSGTFAAGTGTIFKYGAGTYLNVAALRCSIILQDSTGARMTTSSTVDSAGRKLLSTTASATWNSNSLTYTVTNNEDPGDDPYGFGAASSTTPSVLALLVAAAAAFVARF